MKKLLCAALCAALCLFMFGCSGEEQPGPGGSTTRRAVTSGELQFTQPAEGAPIATISTTLGDITVVLFPKQAPMAVENCTGLANSGYYNNMPVSRIVDGFCVQTGLAAGETGEGKTTWGQGAFPNEVTDALHHYAGALATANGGAGGTGNLSQFYFVQCPQGSVSKADAAALKEAGIRIPEDISVIGFDDLSFSSISTPGLTTLRVSKQDMGKAAVRRLRELIQGDTSKLKIQICTQFIERGSVKEMGVE